MKTQFSRIVVTIMIIAFPFSGINMAYPQTRTITIEQAVSLTLDKYPEIKLQQFEIDRVQGQLNQAKLYPNPALSFYSERLKSGSIAGGESAFLLNQSLGFLWTRKSTIKEFNHSYNSEKHKLENQLRLFKYAAREAYIEYHYSDLRLILMGNVTEIMDSLAEADDSYYVEGDISGYDHTRVAVEQLKYTSELNGALEENSIKKNQLYSLLGLSLEEVVQTVDSSLKLIEDPDLASLITFSLANRADKKMIDETSKSRYALLSSLKKRVYPDVSILGGYKTQKDGFDGTVIQLDISLPIFNRNQGSISGVEAELKKYPVLMNLLERRIRREVEQSYNQYVALKKLADTLSQQQEQNAGILIDSTQAAYAEGKLTLVEFLDAVNAYKDDLLTRYDIMESAYISRYKLEMISGMELR